MIEENKKTGDVGNHVHKNKNLHADSGAALAHMRVGGGAKFPREPIAK